MTTLSSKILSQDKEHFSTLAVDEAKEPKISISDNKFCIYTRGITFLEQLDIWIQYTYIVSMADTIPNKIIATEDEGSCGRGIHKGGREDVAVKGLMRRVNYKGIRMSSCRLVCFGTRAYVPHRYEIRLEDVDYM
nr:hypothetical protein [Tanacetum cinerariifolium]